MKCRADSQQVRTAVIGSERLLVLDYTKFVCCVYAGHKKLVWHHAVYVCVCSTEQRFNKSSFFANIINHKLAYKYVYVGRKKNVHCIDIALNLSVNYWPRTS